MFDSLKLADLPEKKYAILRRSSSTRPTLWLAEEDGIRAVVKDFSSNGFLFRNIAGRFLVWRESRAYRRLNGLKGIPALYRVIDGLALVMEEIPGTNLEGIQEGTKLPGEFFDEMNALVGKFHARGIAHCDLKRAPNTLLGRNGSPHIIDWGASISEREFRFFPINLIYRRFLLDDYMAITKLKLRHCPDKISARELARYRYRSGAERLIRFVRDRLRKLLQKIA